MARIKSDYNQHCPAGATTTLHTGSGKIHSILLSSTNTTGAQVIFYDNTAGSGNILLDLYITFYITPTLIKFDPLRPPIFSTGLTVVTPANTTATVITEA